MNEHTIRRCTICGLTYNDAEEFAHCARCGEPTDRLNSSVENPSLAQSRALVSKETADRYAESNAERVLAEQAKRVADAAAERVVAAASAALHFDIERSWLEFDGVLSSSASGA